MVLAASANMRTFTTWFARFALAAAVAGGFVVACRHEAPGPAITPIAPGREAPPLGDQPDTVRPPLNAPGAPGAAAPDPGCPDSVCSDAGVSMGPRLMLNELGVEAVPAQSTRPDAGADAGVALPKVPDAGLVTDAGTPVR